MNILGIDPGTSRSAWVLFDGATVSAHGTDSNDRLLDLMRRRDGDLRWADRLFVEMVASFGMAVGKDVFETVYWIGRFCEAWDHSGARGDPEARRLTRIEIKNHLCHSSRAKDANIRQALIDRLGPPGTKRNPGPTYGISKDCWSALAVAVTAWDKL